MRRPQLIVTDLDGTFLSPDGTVSAENAAAVAAAAEAGVPFVFATGRPGFWLHCLDDVQAAHPLVIVTNGAAVYHLATGELSDVRGIAADTLADFATRVRAAVPGTLFGVEFRDMFAREHELPDSDGSVFGRVGTLQELALHDTVLRLLAMHDELTSDDLLARVMELGTDMQVTYSARDTEHALLELMAPGVSKASALAAICDHLGVHPDAVAAFGDMPNDMDMLDWVGMPFRMDHVHPSLMERGYPAAGSNAESGVGRKVMELLSLRA